MRTRRRHELPARLEGVQRQFERWRRTRKVGSHIPDSLWASAVEAASAYGIHRTARALRLEYYSLKKRVGGEPAAVGKVAEGSAVATFLELPPSAQAASCQCTLELESASGAKMRVHLQGFEAPDLAALSRSFWNVES
jgi:hypothetical protein